MDNQLPLVSIVIPVYNGSNYMRQAIDSALNQTYHNTEVLVINDGSDDGGATREIALSYGEKIRYFEKENGGVSSALNTGIQNMRGEYFSWLSHDDTYGPFKIEHSIDLLCKTGQKDCVAMCRADYIDSESKVMRDAVDRGYPEGACFTWQETLIMLFRHGSFIGCNLLIPKKAFDECGLFDTDMRYVQDIWMWMKLFMKGYSLAITRNIDVHNRVHSGQLTQTGRALFDSESKLLHKMAIGELLRLSTREYNFLYEYAYYNATYHHVEIVKECIAGGRERSLLTAQDILKLRLRLTYGSIRPIIRKTYYAFRNVRTE